MAVTLKELRTRFYDRMDEGQNSSNYVDEPEADTMLNEAYSLLWGIYSRKVPDYFESEATLTPVVGQRDYQLPTDFRSAIKVYWLPQGAGAAHIPMSRIARMTYTPAVPTGAWVAPVPAYEIVGDRLRLQPTPTSIPTPAPVVSLWYRPHYRPLRADEDTLDSRIYPGHEQFIINQAVIVTKIGKEEQPAVELTAMQQALRGEIEADLVQRDLGAVSRIIQSDPYTGWTR